MLDRLLFRRLRWLLSLWACESEWLILLLETACSPVRGTFGGGEVGDLDRLVETVATDANEDEESDLERFRWPDPESPKRCRFCPLSSAALASCSSAIPFLRELC